MIICNKDAFKDKVDPFAVYGAGENFLEDVHSKKILHSSGFEKRNPLYRGNPRGNSPREKDVDRMPPGNCCYRPKEFMQRFCIKTKNNEFLTNAFNEQFQIFQDGPLAVNVPDGRIILLCSN
jgi:hypothetical protein